MSPVSPPPGLTGDQDPRACRGIAAAQRPVMSNPIDQARHLIAALGAISPVHPAMPPERPAFPHAAVSNLAIPHAAMSSIAIPHAALARTAPVEVG